MFNGRFKSILCLKVVVRSLCVASYSQALIRLWVGLNSRFFTHFNGFNRRKRSGRIKKHQTGNQSDHYDVDYNLKQIITDYNQYALFCCILQRWWWDTSSSIYLELKVCLLSWESVNQEGAVKKAASSSYKLQINRLICLFFLLAQN